MLCRVGRRRHRVTSDPGADERIHHNPDDFAPPIVKAELAEKLLSSRLGPQRAENNPSRTVNGCQESHFSGF
jgi:hypothetical protein